MKKGPLLLATVAVVAVGFFQPLEICAADTARLVVVQHSGDAPQARLAAKEVLRYIYLRTGSLPEIAARLPASGDAIVFNTDSDLGAEAFAIKTTAQDGRRIWTISGGGALGELYGAYRFVEKLGVRFYLHGDVLPDERLAQLPELNETGKPLFALRGLNPWGSHPFGFDAWSADDYKALLAQLTKMRMNFLGLHCYPEGLPYAEPTVWHGVASDFDADGRVQFSYVSRYYNTLLTPAWGNFLPKKTSDYSFGGALLFERDDWAPPVLAGRCPLPVSAADCNEVFNRMGTQFRDAFLFARQLGVKTCLGTEAPLTIPKMVQERLRNAGKNPADPSVTREVYEGTFRRIMASHPLDYYWIWTPESWTWGKNKPAQYTNTIADIRLASEAAKNVRAPFQLATCGWVLGPAHDRAAFDHDLPKDIAMSALSRNTGHEPVDAAFGRISGRETWAIPWLESDNDLGLNAPQLYVGRMRRDAVDAKQFGCSGLMGLHWRTEILAPNVSALAQAAWDQNWKSSGQSQGRWATADFYADWARANFGLEAADGVAAIFMAIDGRVPRAATDGCPVGNLSPDPTPWATLASGYAFVDKLEALRPRVRGAGNLDRFGCWLNTFKYYRSLAQVRCALGARQTNEVMRIWADTYRFLIASANTPGALAALVALEGHPGALAQVSACALPPWPKEYQGEPRLIVPCVRSLIGRNESMALTIIAVDNQPMKRAELFWRPLGQGAWQTLGLTRVARAVYRVTLPATVDTCEYYVRAETSAGKTLHWPATAPEINQTVVVMP